MRKHHAEYPIEPENEYIYQHDIGSYAILAIDVPYHRDIYKFWILYFDGFKSQAGMGTSIILISPKHEQYCYSFKLEFDGVIRNISPSADKICSSYLNGSNPEQMSERQRMNTFPRCCRHLECCFNCEPVYLQTDQTCKHIKATKKSSTYPC